MKLYSELARYQGNEPLYEAVEMAITALLGGVPMHLHAQGLRGTGKTTIFRAAAQIMPPIIRIKGCLFNCDPAHPHCPEHRHLSAAQIGAIGVEEVPMPFLEISHSAKIGTVVGSVDLAKITATDKPEAALLPGIIPQAHRGVIFIDEINRLADTAPEITDILLDVMGTKPGRVQIEETGLAVLKLPVQVSIWAASNPDEEPGPLSDVRRQLSDRFDLAIDLGRPANVDVVANILRQHRQVAADSLCSVRYSRENVEISQKLQKAAQVLPDLLVPEPLELLLAQIYVKFGVESLRAVEAWQQAAQARAAIQQRYRIETSDLLAVLPGVLGHRVEPETLVKIGEYIRQQSVGQSEVDTLPTRRARRLTELALEEVVATEGNL